MIHIPKSSSLEFIVTFYVYVYYVHKHQPKSAPNLTINFDRKLANRNS